MSNFNNQTITAKGLELLSGALAGNKIQFTRIVMGAGECTEDIGLAESLVDQKQSLDIKSMSRNGSKVVLSGVLAQTQIKDDFYWKEIGVYAKGADDDTEILYLYGTAKANEYSYISKDMLNEKLINIGVLVSTAQNVSATINTSLVYLSKEDLDNHNNDPNAHPDILKAIENQKSTIDGKENEIVTISKDNKAKTSGIGIDTVVLIDRKSPLGTKVPEDADTLNGHDSEYFLKKIEANAEQINVLNNDRGYLNTKNIVETGIDSCDKITENGLYYLYNSLIKDTPGGGNGYLRVISNDSGNYAFQEFVDVYTGKKYDRSCFNKVWQPWREIATKEKLTILWTGALGTSETVTLADDINKFNKLYFFLDIPGIVSQKIEILSLVHPNNFVVDANRIYGIEGMTFKITSNRTLDFTNNTRMIYSIEGAI